MRELKVEKMCEIQISQYLPFSTFSCVPLVFICVFIYVWFETFSYP